jgi:hypothetical protein
MPYDGLSMPRDVINFESERGTFASSGRNPEIDITHGPPYACLGPKQLRLRRRAGVRWIALAVLVGTIVALVFIILLAK